MNGPSWSRYDRQQQSAKRTWLTKLALTVITQKLTLGFGQVAGGPGQLQTIGFEETGIRINGSTKPRPSTVGCSDLFDDICPFISEFTTSQTLSRQQHSAATRDFFSKITLYGLREVTLCRNRYAK